MKTDIHGQLLPSVEALLEHKTDDITMHYTFVSRIDREMILFSL